MPERAPAPAAPVRRVFLLRPDNLGDVILFSGALRQLRALYPGARVTLCVKRYVGNLLERCPHVDELVFWEDLHAPAPAPLRALRRASFALRHRADVALLPVRSPSAEMHRTIRATRPRAAYGIAGSHANQSAGADAEAAGVYTARLQLPPEREGEHEILVTRDFLRLLGAPVEAADVWPELWTAPEDRAWAERRVARLPDAVTLAICPGVSSPAGKAYPSARYAEVLRALPGTRFSVVLLGSPAERAVCNEVAAALAGCPNVAAVTNLAGESTVREMVECIRRCDAVLGPDTAALHAGVALRMPTVCILGGGHFGRFHPWGDPALNRIAHLPMECYGCNWACRFDTVRCVQEIRPEAVARELEAALGAAAGGGGGVVVLGKSW